MSVSWYLLGGRRVRALNFLGFCRSATLALTVLVLGAGLVLGSTSAAHAGYASIVVDGDTGEVLRARNADTRNYPASLTKMMTLYMTFEALGDGRWTMNKRLKVSKRAVGQPPSKLGLKVGETITVKQAILALVTKSANDVATVLGEALGGTEWEFAQDMTRTARSLGMKKTSFSNASGLPNRRQLSTARDMATLALALINRYPQHYHFFAAESFTFRGKKYGNHNNLLGTYRGVDGVKTGYIRASGFNLVASAERKGRRVVAVVFGGKTAKRRDRHMAGLLDKGFTRVAALDKERGGVRLASVPPPPPRRPGTKVIVHNIEGDWAIQVGAYGRIATAELALREAESKVAHLLEGSIAALTPVTSSRGKMLYRARFLGLEHPAARKACRTLKSSRMPCAVIRADENEVNIASAAN